MDMKRYHKDVESMQRRLPGCIDDPGSSTGRALVKNFQKLEDEVQVGRTGATIQNRLKTIRSLVKKAVNEKVMSHGDADNYEDWINDSLRKIR